MRKAKLAGIVAGSAILALGAAGFVVFLLARLSAFAASLQRFPIPGEAVLELQAGPHTLYWEPGRLLSLWHGLPCTVESCATGKAVEVSTSWMPARYSAGGRRGVAVYVFDAPAPGAYRFTVRDPEGRAKAGEHLAVRASSWGELLVTALGCLLILGGSIAAGVLLILFSVLRKAKPAGPAP
jgi:hypothetical protein